MQKNQKIGQYEILKDCGNDMAIVKDTMFETSDIYIMAISEQLQLLNIKNYDLIGFPSLINQFEWEEKACFIYKEIEGAHLDTIPYDIDFSVNAVRNLCLSIYQIWRLSGGCFYPEINMDELYFTKNENFIFQNAYAFSSYQKCEESFITKQLSYILYQLVTGRKQLDDIRNIDPSFSYILNSTILKCAREETILGLEAFATTLAQYKETDLMVYQQDRSLRPSRRKKDMLSRFLPDPKRLEFYTIRPERNKTLTTTAKPKKNVIDDHEKIITTDIQECKDKITEEQEKRQKEEKNVFKINRNEKRSNVQRPAEKDVTESKQKSSQNVISDQKKQTIKLEKNPSTSTFHDQSDTNQNNEKAILEKLKQNKKSDVRINDNSNKKSKIKEKAKIDSPKKETQKGQMIPKPKKLQKSKRQQQDSINKSSWNHIKLVEPKDHDKEEIKKQNNALYENRPKEASKENYRKIPGKAEDHAKQYQHSHKEIKKEEPKQDLQKKERKTAEEEKQQSNQFMNDRKIERKDEADQKEIIQEEIRTKGSTEYVEKNVIPANKTEISISLPSVEKVTPEDTIEVHDISSDNMEYADRTDSFAISKKDKGIQKRKYRENRKKKNKAQKVHIPKIHISKSVRIGIIGSFLIIASTIGFFAHKTYQQNKYNDMIEVVDRSTNQKEKVRILHQAIDLLPKESKAYERLLNVYLEDAVFSSKEENAYLKTIHQNWDKVKKGDGYGNLAYEIGKAYWYYYEYDNMNHEEITRMKSAVQWFEDSLKYKSTAKHHRIAKIYCEIGKFNQEITLNVKEGTDKGVYKKYYNNLKNLLEIGNSNTVASLELYKLTVNSIDTYRERFIDDGISEEDINQTKQDVLYKVNETSVVTEKEKELKNTILYGSKQ